jgi:hypothetical protein
MVLGIGVVASNLLVGIWGGAAWARGRPSVWFWYLLRAAQGLVAVQVTLGLILLTTGHEPADGLHYVYGISPLLITVFTEGMRSGAAERELEGVEDPEALTDTERRQLARRVVIREMGVMTIGALLIATLSLRAATTG